MDADFVFGVLFLDDYLIAWKQQAGG